MPFAYFQRRTVSPSKTKEKKEKNAQKLSFSDERATANEINDLQNSVDNSDNTQSITQLQEKIDNNTGMPDELKDGVENLSGEDMSDVKVTYNSDQPAQLQANAYASGNDIHVAPGQEKHLPHEAWHVVQQKQNRVRPTIKTDSGELINDDPALEKEADVMGQKALQLKSTEKPELSTTNNQNRIIQKNPKDEPGYMSGVRDHLKKTPEEKESEKEAPTFSTEELNKRLGLQQKLRGDNSEEFVVGEEKMSERLAHRVIAAGDGLDGRNVRMIKKGLDVGQEFAAAEYEAEDGFKDIISKGGAAGQTAPQGPESQAAPQGPESQAAPQGPESQAAPQGAAGQTAPQGAESQPAPQGAESQPGPQGATGPQGQMDVGGGIADILTAANELTKVGESFYKAFKDRDYYEGFKVLSGIDKLALTITDAIEKFSGSDLVGGPIKSGINLFENAMSLYSDGKAFYYMQEFAKNAHLDEKEKKLVKLYSTQIKKNFGDHIIEFVFDIGEIVTGFGPGLQAALPLVKAAHGSYKLMKFGISSFKEWRESKAEKADERLGVEGLYSEDRDAAKDASKLLRSDKKFVAATGYSVKDMVNALITFDELKDQYEKESDDKEKLKIEKDKAKAYEYVFKGIDIYNDWIGGNDKIPKLTIAGVRKLKEFHQNAIHKIIQEVKDQKHSSITNFRKKLGHVTGKEEAVTSIEAFFERRGKDYKIDEVKIDDIKQSGNADYFWGKTDDALAKAAGRNGVFSMAVTNKTISAELSKLLKSDPARFEDLLKSIDDKAFGPGVSYEDGVDKFLKNNKI